MFESFVQHRITTSGAEIAAWTAGSGPPLLLVHGAPQTHVMWHRVAPALADRFTVVAPDLRGYGASSKPPAGVGHIGYSKRTMALDLVEVMAKMGHDRFNLVGHDRGARVGYRMALDHPERVQRLVTLDVIPTLEQFEAALWPASIPMWHWFFLAQPSPIPETMIMASREFFLRETLKFVAWDGSPEAITPAAIAEYLSAFTDETIRAICDDYRANATIDCQIDAEDRAAGRRITAPMLALWSNPTGQRNHLPVWRRWAENVEGRGMACGHFIPEEAPEALLVELTDFLG